MSEHDCPICGEPFSGVHECPSEYQGSENPYLPEEYRGEFAKD
jgi:hypothetical protein